MKRVNKRYRATFGERIVSTCVIAPSAVPWKRGCIDKMYEFCQGFFPVASARESIKPKFTADERLASPACYLTINFAWPTPGRMLNPISAPPEPNRRRIHAATFLDLFIWLGDSRADNTVRRTAPLPRGNGPRVENWEDAPTVLPLSSLPRTDIHLRLPDVIPTVRRVWPRIFRQIRLRPRPTQVLTNPDVVRPQHAFKKEQRNTRHSDHSLNWHQELLSSSNSASSTSPFPVPFLTKSSHSSLTFSSSSFAGPHDNSSPSRTTR